jgi:hypothetical protein
MAVRIEPGGDLWNRLRHWLGESLAAIERGDFSRLPDSAAKQPDVARDSYESVLMAMEILETGSLKPKP